jgi:hypothetical protein
VNQFRLIQSQLPLESMAMGVAVSGDKAFVVLDNYHLVRPPAKVPFRGIVVIDMKTQRVSSELDGLDPGADSIAADSSALDIHDPKGGDVDFQSMPPYEIPYRCLLPQGVEQILVAGRCISADHDAHARSRNMPACMATGQAAGVAAAIAVEDGVTVRQVPVVKVQAALRAIGMPLRASEITEA